jgi:lipoprotein signal peptidase
MTSSAGPATGTRLGHPKASRRAVAWPGWTVAAGVAALDITSTVWASTSLPATGTGTATFGVTLSRLDNRGAAFGFGGAHPMLVLLAAVVSSGAIALGLARSRSRLQRLGLAVALGGGLGGGLGNLAVRVVHGSVIDWIHAAPYPATFNLADVAIRGGLLIVLADALLQIVGGRNTQSANEVR